MIKQKSVNRWSVVFGAVLLQVCLGAIYSWSLFNQPLMDKYGWTNEQVVMTYSIAIFVFAFSTIFSGRLQDKIGPRKVATIGGILYGGGLILASFSKSLPGLYFFYGVLGGAGVGFAYVCPLSTCLKWFPEKKGFITGIAVGAFGGGSLVFKSLIQHFFRSCWCLSYISLFRKHIFTTCGNRSTVFKSAGSFRCTEGIHIDKLCGFYSG